MSELQYDFIDEYIDRKDFGWISAEKVELNQK